jgi:hypothetical protein
MYMWLRASSTTHACGHVVGLNLSPAAPGPHTTLTSTVVERDRRNDDLDLRIVLQMYCRV